MPLLGQNLSGSLKSVAILSPGLMGGSLALALRQARPDLDIRIWARRPEVIGQITEHGHGFFASIDLELVIPPADCVILCMPVEKMEPITRRMLPFLGEKAIVTDVGSVKEPVVRVLEPLLAGRFVGSHPIAGSEKTGFDAAFSGLFLGASCVITPTELTQPEAVDQVTALWELVGCQVFSLSPTAHDEALAYTSHLPHLIASVLASTVAKHAPIYADLVGGGFRDTTRVACGSPEMWTGILSANRSAVMTAIDGFQRDLECIQNALTSSSPDALHRFLAQAKDLREAVQHRWEDSEKKKSRTNDETN